MNTISKINLQKPYYNITSSKNATQPKLTNQPNEDTVNVSNPSFKGGKQVLNPSINNKAKIAYLTFLGTFISSIAAKIATKKEGIIQNNQKELMAKELANTSKYTYYKNIRYDAYTQAEANGIAEFMFDAEVFEQLKKHLEHDEDQNSDSFVNSKEDVLYLGKKIQSKDPAVSKFMNLIPNSKEVIEFLKMHETNPEVLGLKENYKHLASSEVREVLPTYKKYPAQTQKLLNTQEQIRSLKDKINKKVIDMRYAHYGRDGGEVTKAENEAKKLYAELIEISPEYIKNEIKAKLEEKENWRGWTHDFYKNVSIPDIAISDIITAVEENPVKNLRELI